MAEHVSLRIDVGLNTRSAQASIEDLRKQMSQAVGSITLPAMPSTAPASEEMQQRTRTTTTTSPTVASTDVNADAHVLSHQAMENKKTEVTLQGAERRAQAETDIMSRTDQERIRATTQTLAHVGRLFKQHTIAYKAIASAQTFMEGVVAATSMLKLGPLVGPALAAITMATTLANIAKINGVQFRKGGYTGDGSPDRTAGTVEFREFVFPEHMTMKNRKHYETMLKKNMSVEEYAKSIVRTEEQGTRINHIVEANTMVGKQFPDTKTLIIREREKQEPYRPVQYAPIDVSGLVSVVERMEELLQTQMYMRHEVESRVVIEDKRRILV